MLDSPVLPTVVLHAGREKAVLNRHPWVFSGAVAAVHGDPAPGDLVRVVDSSGAFLATGYWNPHSQIKVRLLSWDASERVDAAFWRERLRRAIDARVEDNLAYAGGIPRAYRLVNAENDYLPGLIVDRYGDWLVLQALTLGIDVRKAEIVALLMDDLQPRGIYERSDADVRDKEGLEPAVGLLAGEEPPDLIEIDEHGRRFLVDIRRGHKTGFYLDQRANRLLLGNLLRHDPEAPQRIVLNAFGYTGGFSVYALDGLARRVVTVDISAEAIALARRNVTLNGFPVADDDFVVADVFQYLRACRDARQWFDLIVLDPPKFAPTARQVESAARGYKDINLLAFKLLRPGGLLLTFSCSGGVSADLFRKIVFGALIDAGRDAQVLATLGAAPDHPVALTFPEGEYLKGLLLRVY
ncbi:MAG: 23S rRNA (cytosine(1962)-C(5))-methyltransferase RlmI [Anaerolineae bacterium]|nr:23S rRNA (cytosine(1962)-C(5))-methyltransferase RlmI [Anaerolineae bacterium]